MIRRLVRKTWTQLLIAFNDRYTLEGFQRTQRKLECPENSNLLDSHSKRELTICNLFANQSQSVWNIAHLLDVSTGKVVVTLIKHGLINERRVREERAKYERRQKPLHVQPMHQSKTAEVPAQFDLPFSMSQWIATDGLKSGERFGTESVTHQSLAS